MREIDLYSYQCGIIDCFNEMVHAGVKQLALSHPVNSREERDAYLAFSRRICGQYGTRFHIEDTPLLTDLFPVSMNQGKFLIIYYRTDKALQEYLSLKQDKQLLLVSGTYAGEPRRSIAVRFGQLLSYTDEAIDRLIRENTEKEPQIFPER